MSLDHNEVLELWHRISISIVRRDFPELTPRQFAIFLQVYLAPQPHTVRGLASSLAISKPAVTRAIDRLSSLNFLRRKIDEADRRSVFILRTVQGSVFLREFGDLGAEIAASLGQPGDTA